MSTILAAAKMYADLGFRVIPLNGKVPVLKDWLNRASNDNDQIEAWLADGTKNFGVLTGEVNRLVIEDIDEKKTVARNYFKKFRGELKTVVETQNGIHAYFQKRPGLHVPNILNREAKMDVLVNGKQAVGAGSEVAGWTYRFVEGHPLVRVEDLPIYDPQKHGPPPRSNSHPRGDRSNNIPIDPEDIAGLRRRVLNYLSTIPVSSERGHNATYRACAIMRDKFQVPPHEAWTILQLWSQSGAADPPLDLKSLHQKWKDVFLNQPTTN